MGCSLSSSRTASATVLTYQAWNKEKQIPKTRAGRELMNIDRKRRQISRNVSVSTFVAISKCPVLRMPASNTATDIREAADNLWRKNTEKAVRAEECH